MRVIVLRRPDRCFTCATELAAGDRAGWDAAARSTTCLPCLLAKGTPPERGEAGASASRIYEHRSERYREAERQRVAADAEWRRTIRETHPVLGRLAIAVTPRAKERSEPSHITSWSTGAPGEVRVGAVLDGVKGIVALHDRRIRGRRANIDHIAIAPAAVWVIDAKRYPNSRVEYHDAGGWFGSDPRLRVGGRDRTGLVDAVTSQVGAVGDVLAAGGFTVQLRAMLCFVDSTWGWFAKPFMVRGVAITWPQAMPEMLQRTGPIEGAAITRIARHLAVALPPA